MDVHRNSRLEESIKHAMDNIPLKTNVFIETGLNEVGVVVLLFKQFKSSFD